MKLIIERRSEVLSTGTQGLVLDATILLPGASTSTTTSCCTCTTCGMTAFASQSKADNA